MNGSSQHDFSRGLGGSSSQLAPEQVSSYLQQQALLQQPQYGSGMQPNNLEALLRSTALAQQLQNNTGVPFVLHCKAQRLGAPTLICTAWHIALSGAVECISQHYYHCAAALSLQFLSWRCFNLFVCQKMYICLSSTIKTVEKECLRCAWCRLSLRAPTVRAAQSLGQSCLEARLMPTVSCLQAT